VVGENLKTQPHPKREFYPNDRNGAFIEGVQHVACGSAAQVPSSSCCY